MHIKKPLSIITLTGMLIINTSSYSLSQSSEVKGEEQSKTSSSSDYTIIKGDTLWDISDTFLKDPFLWPNIWKNNDYIRNPDLIYPGNKLTIYPVMTPEPDSAADEAFVPRVEATLPEQTAIPAFAEPSPASVPLVPSRPKSPPAPASPTVAKSAISADTIEASGYLIHNIEGYGVIRGSKEGRNIFADGDMVNISLANNFADKVSLGDKFTIFRTSGPVIHPKTRKNSGYLFIPIGVIEINRVQGRDASGELIRSYNYASVGDRIQPYIPAQPVDKIIAAAADIRGYIIEAQEGLALSAQHSIVYLDRGAADGITPGTILYVIRDKKEDIIGELHVVSVQNNTSTALVTKSSEPFGTGSKVTTIVK